MKQPDISERLLLNRREAQKLFNLKYRLFMKIVEEKDYPFIKRKPNSSFVFIDRVALEKFLDENPDIREELVNVEEKR